MNIWEKLEREIEVETRAYFKGKSRDIGELVKLLQQVFMARINSEYKLDAVAVNIPKAMYEILDGETKANQRALNFEILSKFEPFLRKMLFLLKPQEFQEIVDAKKGLSAIISALRLNPHHINYTDEEANDRRDYSEYDYHLFKVYNLRNTQSHEMEQWGGRQLAENIESIFIFYLEVLHIHKAALKEVLSKQENDFSEYIASVINEFEANSRRFISMESMEDLSVFESYAIEHKNNIVEDEAEDEAEQERTGTVDFIRKNCLPEKRMILWGDAGMGKSTTLQYLAYIDAKEYESEKSNILPIYVPLGMLIDQEETLEQYICRKINVEFITGVDLFRRGKITLFLDGVNEIPAGNANGIQKRRLNEIQHLLDTYPKMLILLSNRPESYNCFQGIPVFRLQKMDLKKIQEFLQKNAGDEKVRNTILEGIKKNHRLLQLIGTPLMATRLIGIVRELKEFPQSEGTIIKKFLESLYKREKYDKKEVQFNELITNSLLIHLAAYGFKKNSTNSGLPVNDVIACFANCIENYHFSYDSYYALDILLKLGVLSSDKNKEVIVFSHQAYQDYYLSCATGNNSSKEPEVLEVLPAEDGSHKADKVEVSPGQSIAEAEQDINAECEGNGREAMPDQADLLSNAIGMDDTQGIDDVDLFYRNHAKDESYEKSIIYRLHNTLDRDLRNHNIKCLAQYNLLLAAKAISTGEFDDEIEGYIIGKALENIKKSSEADIQLESVLVFLELDRTEELKDNVSILIQNGANTIRSIVLQLNGEQCLTFLDSLCQQEEDKILRGVLSTIINVAMLNKYEYSWSGDNIRKLERITRRLHILLKAKKRSYMLLNFYDTFNVPKKYLSENISKILDNNLVKHYDFVKEFINKYNISYNLTIEKRLELASQKNIWTLFSLMRKLHLSFNEKFAIVEKYFPRKQSFRSCMYFCLPIECQYGITKKYDVCFKGTRNYKKRIPIFLKLFTESEMTELVFQKDLIKAYEQDKEYNKRNPPSFSKFLRSIQNDSTITEEELLQNSTLDDFIEYQRILKMS